MSRVKDGMKMMATVTRSSPYYVACCHEHESRRRARDAINDDIEAKSMEIKNTFTSELIDCKRTQKLRNCKEIDAEPGTYNCHVDARYDCFSGNEPLARNIHAMAFSNLEPINTITVVNSQDIDTLGLIGGYITCTLAKDDYGENMMYCDSGGEDPSPVTINGTKNFTVNDNPVWCAKNKYNKIACVDAKGLSEARSKITRFETTPIAAVARVSRRRRS